MHINAESTCGARTQSPQLIAQLHTPRRGALKWQFDDEPADKARCTIIQICFVVLLRFYAEDKECMMILDLTSIAKVVERIGACCPNKQALG